jgi:hypothetical protein
MGYGLWAGDPGLWIAGTEKLVWLSHLAVAQILQHGVIRSIFDFLQQ